MQSDTSYGFRRCKNSIIRIYIILHLSMVGIFLVFGDGLIFMIYDRLLVFLIISCVLVRLFC